MPTHDPTRRRASLNLSLADYAVIEQLTEHEHCSVHEVIRRSVRTRRQALRELDPAWANPNLRPEDLPEPATLAYVGQLTGTVRIVGLGS